MFPASLQQRTSLLYLELSSINRYLDHHHLDRLNP
jgi:hypothetical protein